jgi:hypothetical protein
MFIRILEDGSKKYPYQLADLFADESSTSFSIPIVDEELASFGVYPMRAGVFPPHDHTKDVIEVEPVQIDGAWTQQFELVDATQETIAQRTAAQTKSVRAERNTKLAASDWTQLADSTANKTAWATYRQALRDVTQQSGFPWTIEWPETP